MCKNMDRQTDRWQAIWTDNHTRRDKIKETSSVCCKGGRNVKSMTGVDGKSSCSSDSRSVAIWPKALRSSTMHWKPCKHMNIPQI
jgi:hypothetical protein